MLFSFMTRSRLSSHYAGPAALAACSSEGPKHSARPGFQPKVGDAVFREWPDRCRHAARDCLAGDREGFVGIIDGGRNDTPAPVLADFRVGPRNEHHPTLHGFLSFFITNRIARAKAPVRASPVIAVITLCKPVTMLEN
jgi:hypothetical protein